MLLSRYFSHVCVEFYLHSNSWSGWRAWMQHSWLQRGCEAAGVPLPSLEIPLLQEPVLSCTGWKSRRSRSWLGRVDLLHIMGQGEIFERTGGLFSFCSFSRPQLFLIWGKIVTKLVKVTEWWLIIHVNFHYTTRAVFQSIQSKHLNFLGPWWSKSSHYLMQRTFLLLRC